MHVLLTCVPVSLAEEVLGAGLELFRQKGKAGVAPDSLSGIESGLPRNLRLVRQLAEVSAVEVAAQYEFLHLVFFCLASFGHRWRWHSASFCRGVMFRWLQPAWSARASLGLFSGSLVLRKAREELEKL